MDKKIMFDFIENVVSCLNRYKFLYEKDMEEWMPFISKYFYNKRYLCNALWCCFGVMKLLKKT